MNKIKSPFVKMLRKAGYSTKEAMNITFDAQYYTLNQGGAVDLLGFNRLTQRGLLDGLFSWTLTEEGFDYWDSIYKSLK